LTSIRSATRKLHTTEKSKGDNRQTWCEKKARLVLYMVHERSRPFAIFVDKDAKTFMACPHESKEHFFWVGLVFCVNYPSAKCMPRL